MSCDILIRWFRNKILHFYFCVTWGQPCSRKPPHMPFNLYFLITEGEIGNMEEVSSSDIVV